MNQKEIKKSIKLIKEAIQTKHFEVAEKHCQAVREADSKNYSVLVFHGFVLDKLQRADDSLTSYQSAVEIDDTQLPAWQGLASFYENRLSQDGHQKELASVYKKLVELHESASKKTEVFMKYVTLQEPNIDERPSLVEDIRNFLSHNGLDNNSRSQLKMKLIFLLDDMLTLSNEQLELLCHTYHDYLADNKAASTFWKSYVSKLVTAVRLEVFDLNHLAEECRAATECISDEPALFECYIVAVFDDLLIHKQFVSAEEHLTVLKTFADTHSESSLSNIVKAWDYFQDNQLDKCRHCLDIFVRHHPTLVCGLYFLAKVLLLMHSGDQAETFITAGQQHLESASGLVTTSVYQKLFDVLLLEVYAFSYNSDKIDHGVELGQRLISTYGESEDLACLYAVSLLNQYKLESADEVISKLEVLESSSWSYFLRAKYFMANSHWEDCLLTLSSGLKQFPDDPSLLLLFAQCNWNLGSEHRNRKNVAIPLLKCRKLDPPYDTNIYLYLGFYYRDIAAHKQRARKCFSRSYHLNNQNQDACKAYVDWLSANGETDSALKLLETADWDWARSRLGVHYLNTEDPEKAISIFQRLVKKDHVEILELLAESYMLRGSICSALGCYETMSAALPNNVAVQYQLATIKYQLGDVVSALSNFDALLQCDEKYLPGLYGVARCHLELCRKSIEQCFPVRAVGHLQHCLNATMRSLTVNSSLACTWKLFGDACSTVWLIDESFLTEVVLQGRFLCARTEWVNVNKVDILELGARSFEQALHLWESASVWCDLGINLLYQYQFGGDVSLLDRANDCVHRSVSLDPENSAFWNALGLVALYQEDFASAQHSFVKAITIDNFVLAWANLGVLYLLNDEIHLAHQAFRRAQSLDPQYLNSWIGQALIAEKLGHSDALHLFQHTVQLGFHHQSCMGFAKWACLSACAEGTTVAAFDGISKSRDMIGEASASLLSMYGVLAEKCHLTLTSRQAFIKLLSISQRLDLQDRNIAFRNYASSLDDHKSAISFYKKIQPLSHFSDMCMVARTLSNAGLFKESLATYQHLMAKSEDDELRLAAGIQAIKLKNFDDANRLIDAIKSDGLAMKAVIVRFILSHHQGGNDHDLLSRMGKLAQENTKHVDNLCQLFMLFSEHYSFVAKLVHCFPWVAGTWMALANQSVPGAAQLRLLGTCYSPEVGRLICRACLNQNFSQHVFRDIQSVLHSNPADIFIRKSFEKFLKLHDDL